MKITRISYRKGFQAKTNQSRIFDQEITAHADIEGEEDPGEAMKKLHEWIQSQVIYLKALDEIAK